MKEESLNIIKSLMITNLKRHGDNKILAIGRNVYTGNDLAKHIEEETKVGLQMIDNVLNLTIDLLSRDKIST